MNRRGAFTLIELLVVIAVIAVLMSILMPALNRARELARSIICLSNQKSLAAAYIMYADDNDGSMVGGFCTYDITNGVPPWVKPPLEIGPTGNITRYTSDATLQQRINGIRAGALYPYVQEYKAFHCPGDFRYNRGTSLGNQPRYLIYRSYSLPGDQSTSYGLRATESGNEKKLFNYKRQAEKYLFVEEIYDGGATNYNDEGWSYEIGAGWMWDPLGIFHSDSCTFSFMDGHAIRKKWADKRTIIFCTDRQLAQSRGFGKGQVFNPPNPDLHWLDEHYPLTPLQSK